MPLAILASTLAVAGTITRASARLRHGHVLDGALQVRAARRSIEHVRDDFSAGEGGKSKGSDELARIPRHHDLDFQPALLQQTHEFGRLVSGNTARDSQDNCAWRIELLLLGFLVLIVLARGRRQQLKRDQARRYFLLG